VTVAAIGLYGAAPAAAIGVTATPDPATTSPLPVNYNFAAAFAAKQSDPTTPPPGANNFSCRPSADHPYPVVLVNGTFANMDSTWQGASPLLANHGYCVYAFNYGGTSPTAAIQGIGDIAAGAGTLSSFVRTVLAAAGTDKADLVGYSLGGMMSRYYINFLGGASTVHTLVALAPSNYGTTLDGIITLADKLGAGDLLTSVAGALCQSCTEQEQGSPFLAKLNAAPTVPGVRYVVIENSHDEVVTPYTNAFLPAAANVTAITLSEQCPLDNGDHLETVADPVALADVLNALDPDSSVRVPCVSVRPFVGPAGPVPPF
jgi:triacylglycerol esterase/lipase EstA (alpha/beta hydrolase family)